ncbi:MAG: 4Fe-4S binding protein [Candidatus Omnitrophica bacterium]|nr:4Fe-4S binding protein [Candidatus Omnitrophota bacterium]
MAKRKIINIDEEKCNGCGLCIPNCPEGAIRIIDKKARLISDLFCDGLGACLGYCPQGAISIEEREAAPYDGKKVNIGSGLCQWPIQLCLVPAHAPYFEGADVLISADCVPFAYADFHQDLLRNKILLVGCPKFDDISLYREKLKQIFTENNIKSVTCAHMEVPCCFGLLPVINAALKGSGKKIPFEDITISIKGKKV